MRTRVASSAGPNFTIVTNEPVISAAWRALPSCERNEKTITTNVS